MIRNYLLTAFRAFTRERSFTTINLMGLAIGLACTLLLTLYVREEASYDRFHTDADRIYRIITADSMGGNLMQTASVIGLVTPRFEERIPQIESSVRLHREQAVFSVEAQLFEERDFFWADPNVFDVFDFPLREGDAATALQRPGTIVLSPKLAYRLFGDGPAVGQHLRIDGQYDLEVTGLLETPPSASHLHPAALASMRTLGEMTNPWVSAHQGWSYLRLAADADPRAVEEVMNSHLSEIVTWFNLDAMYLAYHLQPLAEIRLHSAKIQGAGDVSDVRYVYLFSIVAALILVIACVNFTNLATARSLKRIREVGMRKTLGASRIQIVTQFLGESVGLAVVAMVIALGLLELAHPYIHGLFGKQLDLDYANDPLLLVWLLVLTVVTGLTAGSIPAVFVSRFDPIRSVKGLAVGKQRSRLRQGLVVTQFAISVGLVFATLVIRGQMDYIQDKNLGFQTHGVFAIRTDGLGERTTSFKRLLLDVPGVEAVSHASGFPMGGGLQSNTEIDGKTLLTMYLAADEDYVEAMGLEMAAGRDYDADRPGDASSARVVTESYARARGWENPLQEHIATGQHEDGSTKYADIIGVVRDFHTTSLHRAIIPTIIDVGPSLARFRSRLIVRVGEGQLRPVMDQLEALWPTYVPDRPLSIHFADDYVQSHYEAETRMGQLFSLFTLLAMGIAGLGLFGLAAYAAERRTKEIGIRKVLGASIGRVVALLMIEYVWLVVLAVMLGLPVAYIAINRWMEGFAYRIDVTPSHFLLAGSGALLFALLTVVTQAARTARSNPVESLRHE